MFSFQTRRHAQAWTPNHDPRRNGFSLVEILTVVALLTFIILGLVAMFGQTRRAFMSSMTQVDVLGSGRMAADMIGREVEQLAPTTASGTNNEINFYVSDVIGADLIQPLDYPPSGNDNWINHLQRLYFLTRNNQQWNAIGYRLDISDYGNGIGTLYRYGSTNIDFTNYNGMQAAYAYFINTSPTNNYWSRIIDGVVDFRIKIYDQNGNPIQNTNAPQLNVGQNIYGNYTNAVFWGDALPAYVEIELGVLEDRTFSKYQALASAGTGPGTASWNFLTDHAAQVHIFRQRIPIRNVNPAYP